MPSEEPAGGPILYATTRELKFYQAKTHLPNSIKFRRFSRVLTPSFFSPSKVLYNILPIIHNHPEHPLNQAACWKD